MKEYIAKKASRFPLDLQFFAEDPPADPPADPPVDPPGKTFTQAELDAKVQSRLSRAEKAANLALAKDFGYDSVEAMQTALKPKGKEKEDGKLDPAEVSRLVDEQIKEREKEQNQKTFKRLLNAEVKVLANELGFVDWEDATLADLSAVKENEKGELEGVKEALEALAKKKPHLLKAKPTAGRFGANVLNSPDQKNSALENIKKIAQNDRTATAAANDPWAKK
ncbi:scaffolding protein [Paenibacillus helianthi]|uniref:Scaffolding protein n=1 Tax=Paenibacillus helianthi TaxID=1349432 RepID=A0ABX3EUM9_9BACL|nr:scaffolding protein [Paenibacillus helianthi]OKP91854.1 scaffolding protein [Paenibacillus helianthi]